MSYVLFDIDDSHNHQINPLNEQTVVLGELTQQSINISMNELEQILNKLVTQKQIRLQNKSKSNKEIILRCYLINDKIFVALTMTFSSISKSTISIKNHLIITYKTKQTTIQLQQNINKQYSVLIEKISTLQNFIHMMNSNHLHNKQQIKSIKNYNYFEESDDKKVIQFISGFVAAPKNERAELRKIQLIPQCSAKKLNPYKSMRDKTKQIMIKYKQGLLNRVELIDHAQKLRIMLHQQQYITTQLKESKQMLVDYIKDDGREALVTFFKMKGAFGGHSVPRNNTIALSVGGSKDVNNFREKIEQNIMPLHSDISYNGIFYEYYFDIFTNERSENAKTNTLFFPSYCYGRSNSKHYLNIGLNSNIKQNEFERKHLNLVIVLDNSGSMSQVFKNESGKNVMTIANECCVDLLKHLTNKDRFGMVTFNTDCKIIQKLQPVCEINFETLKKKVLSINAGGGTNFEIGYNAAIALFDQHMFDENSYENRIIFLTDACPNTGITNPKSLLGMVAKYANNGLIKHFYPTPVPLNEIVANKNINNRIYTTFIGIGLDFNSKLISEISKTRGCNYFSIHSTKQFIKTMNEEFEYMVTPLVFNVSLKLLSEGNCYVIKNVFGSGNENECKEMIESGEIQKINTLFPSKRCTDTGQAKGGIVLIELQRNSEYDEKDGVNVLVEIKYEDRNGKQFESKQSVNLNNIGNEINDMIDSKNDDNYFDNTGIRKAILLTKYVELIRDWIKEIGNFSKHNEKWKNKFAAFSAHFKSEMNFCKDKELENELDVLRKLSV